MKKVLFFACLISISLYSCDKTRISDQKNYLVKIDTILVNDSRSEIKDIQQLLSGYYLRFGVAIPNYYLIKDSLSIDLNGDRLIDTLVLLSPILIEDNKYAELIGTKNPKRVLAEVLNLDGSNSKIRKLYYHLVSDIPGPLSKYSGMYRTNKWI